jgi:hypothetical protein
MMILFHLDYCTNAKGGCAKWTGDWPIDHLLCSCRTSPARPASPKYDQSRCSADHHSLSQTIARVWWLGRLNHFARETVVMGPNLRMARSRCCCLLFHRHAPVHRTFEQLEKLRFPIPLAKAGVTLARIICATSYLNTLRCAPACVRWHPNLNQDSWSSNGLSVSLFVTTRGRCRHSCHREIRDIGRLSKAGRFLSLTRI